MPVLLVAAITRLFNLDVLGPFIDETGHIDRAKHYDYFSLYQRVGMGKILGYVLFYPTSQWAVNPLYTTRLLVGFTGIVTTAGVFLLTQRLGGSLAAILAGLMWAASPYVTFHDRLSLHDPFVSFFMVWAAFFAVEAVKKNSWQRGLGSGLLLAFAVLVKATALLWAVWPLLLSCVHVDFSNIRRYARAATMFVAGAALPALFVLFIVVFNVNNFLESAKYYLDLFVDPTSRLDRRQLLLINIARLQECFVAYNSVPFGILSLLTVFLSVCRPSKVKSALLFSFLAATVVHSLLFAQWYPRYIVPNLIPLVILVALASAEWCEQVGGTTDQMGWRKWAVTSIAALILFLLLACGLNWASSNQTFQANPLEAKIPSIDQYQYLNGWPSGIGVAETVAFLKKFAENGEKNILVITGGLLTHGFWSIPLFLKDSANIQFRPIYRVDSAQDLSPILVDAAKGHVLLLLEPPKDFIPPDIFAMITPSPTLVFVYNRPKAEGGFRIYELDQTTHLQLSFLTESATTSHS